MTSRLLAKPMALRALLQRSPNGKPQQSGFTLVELLIVVVIVGILSAVALPSFLNQRDRAEKAALDGWAAASAKACAALVVAGEDADWTNQLVAPPSGTATNTCTKAAGGAFTGGTKTWTVSNTGKITTANI